MMPPRKERLGHDAYPNRVSVRYKSQSQPVARGFLHINKDLHAYITGRQVSLKIASLLKEML